MEELIKKLEALAIYLELPMPDQIKYVNETVIQLKQLQEIKDYLKLSVKDCDKYMKKYADIAEHTHSYNDLYKSNLFEGMAEAYSDILDRYFKEGTENGTHT